MKSKATPMPTGRPSKEDEERFLKAGEKMFATAFPTPEGTRRFDSAALKAAAYRSRREALPEDLVDELTWCSETFVEYGRYLQEARFARRMRYLAACAVLVLGLGGGLWWYLAGTGLPGAQEPLIGREDAPRQETPFPSPEPQAPQKQEQTPEESFQVALLDLRHRGTMRGEQGQEPSLDVPVLPARRLDLTVYLPIGSEEGEYEIAVAGKAGEAPLATARASARLVDENVTLATRLDLSSFNPGPYSVGLRRGEFRWSYFPIRLQ